jgi:hypothetical protein
VYEGTSDGLGQRYLDLCVTTTPKINKSSQNGK